MSAFDPKLALTYGATDKPGVGPRSIHRNSKPWRVWRPNADFEPARQVVEGYISVEGRCQASVQRLLPIALAIRCPHLGPSLFPPP